MPEFNRLEQKLVTLSARRYERPVYRWGHLLSWLVLPLGCLSFVPSLKPYETLFAGIVIVLAVEWYHVLTTRVIGKLNAQAQVNTHTAPK